jgi:hypothetical protein
MATRSTLETCPPAWSTRRRPERPTWGPKVGEICYRMTGRRPMPWQQHVWDVALEIDPATGELAYSEVIVTVPRQSGKTTLILPRVVWRAEAAHLLGGRQVMVYAAQRVKDAKRKWRNTFVEELRASKVMSGRFSVTLRADEENVRFSRSGSLFGPIATGATSGHGDTLDDGTLDEAFSQVDGRVEDAWNPAMITRPQSQMWIISTAGTAKSLYLKNKIKRGRAITEAARPNRTAYFEWSADPDADPEDPATWRSCMPALGWTIREDRIRHAFESIEGGLPAFRRAYLCQWPDELESDPWVIDEGAYWRCEDESSTRVGPMALALDISPDRSSAAIGYTANRADGLPMYQVVRHGGGSDWAQDDVVKLAREKGATCVVIDAAGPAANKIDDLRSDLGTLCPVVALTSTEMANATSDVVDAVMTNQLRHTGQASVADALAGTVALKVGDRWRPGRRRSTADITPFVCLVMSMQGLKRHPGGGSILW